MWRWEAKNLLISDQLSCNEEALTDKKTPAFSVGCCSLCCAKLSTPTMKAGRRTVTDWNADVAGDCVCLCVHVGVRVHACEYSRKKEKGAAPRGWRGPEPIISKDPGW